MIGERRKIRTSWLVTRWRSRHPDALAHLFVSRSAGSASARRVPNYSSVPLSPIPVLAFRNSRGVIGFAPGLLLYKCPSNGASMKGRPEA